MAEKQQRNSTGKRRSPWLKPHDFKPGQTGNPGGRPKGRTLMSVVREMLSKPNGDETELEEVARNIVEAMKGKNFQFVNAYVEREEGKVPDHTKTEATVELVVRLEGPLEEWAK